MKHLKDLIGKEWQGLAWTLCTAAVVVFCLFKYELVLYGIGIILGFFHPIIVGVTIAYVLNPFVSFFSRTVWRWVRVKELQRGLSILTAMILAISLVSVVLILVTIRISDNISDIMHTLSGLVNNPEILQSWITNVETFFQVDVEITEADAAEAIEKVIDFFRQNSSTALYSSIRTGKKIISYALGLVLSFYFLNDAERLTNGWIRLCKALIPEEKWNTIAEVGTRADRIMVRYIKYDLFDSLIIGVANLAFMLIVGMPDAALISIIVAVTNLAPTFGPVIGAVNGVIILALEEPQYIIPFLVFTVILQTVDGYLLKPRLFGSLLGVSSVLILVSIIIGGRIFGLIGILLSIPFAAIVDFLYREYALPALEAKRAEAKQKKSS